MVVAGWIGASLQSAARQQVNAQQPSVVAQTDAVVLPGARPTIHAARYPSIQAAIDALPAEGGVVQ